MVLSTVVVYFALAWKSLYVDECTVNEVGATRCTKVAGGSCTLRQPASVLSLELIQRKCPEYRADSTPNYVTPIICGTNKPDPDLLLGIANLMFQRCGHWCVYSDSSPQEKAWMWDKKGCWSKSQHCLEVQDEKDHAISQKLKFCPDLATARDLLHNGKAAGSLNMFDSLINSRIAENDSELSELLSQRSYANALLAREESARHDSDKAVSMDEANPFPRYMRAKVRLTAGKAEDALYDISTARELLAAWTTTPNSDLSPVTKADLDKLEALVSTGQREYEQGLSAFNAEIIPTARYHFDQARRAMPQSPAIRLYIAECDLANNNEQKAEEVLSEVASLLRADPNNIHALIVRGRAYEILGNLDMAINHFKEALRLDPDHVRSKKIFKRLRKIQSLVQEGNEHSSKLRAKAAVESFQQVLELNPPKSLQKTVLVKMCQEDMKMKRFGEAVDHCSKALDLDNGLVDAMTLRGDARMELQDYDKAIRDYETVFNSRDGRTRDMDAKISRAKRLLKQAKMKDYYKILDVPRQATDREIKVAYRKLALLWHPDKHQGEGKDEAEVKFQEIALAYEILSDPEKRAVVDRGEDPNDQSNDNGPRGGGGGFQNFNMGGRSFHFKFG